MRLAALALAAALAPMAPQAFGQAAAPQAAANAGVRLAEAARTRDWATVRQLARQRGLDVDARSVDGSQALLWAIRSGEHDMTRLLIDAGANVNQANLYGLTPLILAINMGDAAVVDLLLQKGADARAQEQSGESMLMLAARQGSPDIVRALIARGADVDRVEAKYDQNALMIAVREDRPQVVEALIRAGAKLDHRTPPGPEPITRPPGAGGGSHGDGIVRGGVPPEGQRVPGSGRMSALMYAARDGRLEAARLLIQAGADIELPEFNQMTPLMMALQNDHHDVAKALVEAGAKVNVEDWYGREPLWMAVESRNREAAGNPTPATNGVDRALALQVITLLLEKGADPNGRVDRFPPRRGGHAFNLSWVNVTGETAFFKAALTGDVEVMRLLLRYGANPNLATFNGTTPLMAAAGVNWVKGQTWTEGAARLLEAVQLCVERGADVNAVNQMGLAAVHGAANRGSNDILQYLAAKGARLDVKDEIGRTPMTWAQGVFLASDAAEAKPETMALIARLLGEGGSGTGGD